MRFRSPRVPTSVRHVKATTDQRRNRRGDRTERRQRRLVARMSRLTLRDHAAYWNARCRTAIALARNCDREPLGGATPSHLDTSARTRMG